MSGKPLHPDVMMRRCAARYREWTPDQVRGYGWWLERPQRSERQGQPRWPSARLCAGRSGRPRREPSARERKGQPRWPSARLCAGRSGRPRGGAARRERN